MTNQDVNSQSPPPSRPPSSIPDSPRWGAATKIIIVLGMVVFAFAVLWRFQTLISPLIIAIILSYLLNPLINFITERTRLGRNTSTTLVYITFTLILIGISVAIGVAVYLQVVNLITILPDIIATLPERLQEISDILAEPIEIGGFTFTLPIGQGEFNFESFTEQILGYLNPLLTSAGSLVSNFAFTTVTTLGWLVFILFVSIYISNDIPKLGGMIGRAASPSGYQYDVERLWREFGRVWNAYLRGQVILGLVIGVSVSVILGALGVQNALALGLISGLLEFIPVVGPIIGAGAAILVALFQPENYLGLTTLQFAGVVLVAMIIIQQIENNFLVPRIVGDALDLHPLLVLVGAIMGSSLAGILGAILAAPVIASLKLLGSYAWRKLLDLPPFTGPEPDDSDHSSWLEQAWERWQLRRAGLPASKKERS